jgi:hypothetical protein
MINGDFETLFKLIGSNNVKDHSLFRKAILAIENLHTLSLQYLTTGNLFHCLVYLFKFSKKIISNIIP